MTKTRILSFLLTLALLTSLLSGVSVFAAGATTNTGTRHQLCTSLSSQAVAYYTGTNTWENLSELNGVYTDSSVEAAGSPLFTALQNLMSGTLTNTVSYSSLTGYWKTTDASNNSNDACLIYADAIASGYNREHVWPKSHGNFYESGAGSDLHHLRPSDQTVNSTRNHWTFGNTRELLTSYRTCEYGGRTVLWYDSSYSGNNCLGIVEINDNIKGDIARILLYVYVTYGKKSGENLNLCTKTSSSGSGNNANTGDKIIYDLATLLQWCENDPVDTWEMSRNDCVENIQGNRNVFIDYPEFAWLLFNRELPDMDTPSGEAKNQQTTAFTVTAVSSDSSLGTVSGSGRVFTAVPAEGAYVASYTLVPADAAQVTRSDNTFRLSNITADCTLTVVFGEKTPATVSYSTPAGVSAPSVNTYLGDRIVLTSPTGTPTETTHNYTFLGWAEQVFDNVDSKPEFYPAGASYIVTGNTVFYALYRYSVGGTGTTDEFTKVTKAADIENGRYLLISAESKVAMGTECSSNWAPAGSSYNTGSDTLAAIAATDVWTYTDGVLSADAGYLYCPAAKQIQINAENSTVFSFSVSGSGWRLSCNAGVICKNGSNGFRPYSGDGYGTDKVFLLYRAGSGGDVFYTTVLSGESPCAHDWGEGVVTDAPTCKETGKMTWTCKLCGATKTEVLPKTTEHTWDDGRQDSPATCTEPGTAIFTCIVCGTTKTESVGKALEHDYEVHAAQAPTCTEPGWEAYQVCRRCSYSTFKEIAPLGHEYENGVCIRCGETIQAPKDPCEGYIDINRGAWYHSAADFVISAGIMGSTSTEELTFEPNTPCTRAMIVSILYRLSGSPETPYRNVFPDVPGNQWFSAAVIWAYDNGIVKGYDTGKFGPNDKITREQMAVILKAYAAASGIKTDDAADLSAFPDASLVTWSRDAVCWAVGAGILSGKENNGVRVLDPRGNAARAEVASILMRFVSNILVH